MSFRILVVDDHKMVTDFYQRALTIEDENTVVTAINSLEKAYNIIFIEYEIFDFVILDLSMPAYLDKNLNDGEDLAILIRNNYPKVKIIIITGYYEPIRLSKIWYKIYPEGILEKSDIDYSIFVSAFKKIQSGEFYKSAKVEKNMIYKGEDIYFDSLNRQIIKLIAQGIKTKNIPKYLPINLSGVHKRKQKIKKLLKIEDGNDEDIIRVCKEKFII